MTRRAPSPAILASLGVLVACGWLSLGRPAAVLGQDAEGCGGPPTTQAYPTPSPGAADPSLVASVAVGALPVRVVVDATDPRGRIFVANSGAGTVSVLEARSTTAADVRLVATVPVGGEPGGLALDPDTGAVAVTSGSTCTLSLIDGRAASPSVTASVTLGTAPGEITLDPSLGLLFVAEPVANQVAAFAIRSPHDLKAAFTFPVADGPHVVAVDPRRSRLYVGTDQTVEVYDSRAAPPSQIVGFPSSLPSGFAIDEATGRAFVVSNRVDGVTSVDVGQPQPILGSIGIEPSPPPGEVLNPVAPVWLPLRQELLVTEYGVDRVVLIRVDPKGLLSFDRAIEGVPQSVGAALDPVTGRVFVTDRETSHVSVLQLEVPTPLELPFVLPGPLDVSLAPQDVARSLSLTALVMLLVGFPTHLFNSTLESNLDEIRRKLPFGRAGRAAAWARWIGERPIGAALYLVVAVLLYAFLDRRFPGSGGLGILAATAIGIALATGLSVGPGERFVFAKFKRHGRLRVAGWTLGLAAGCVTVARLTNVEPGYVFGIVGVIHYGDLALTREDQGRMAWRGGVLLLGVAFAAWFLRIPFQPSPGASLDAVPEFVNGVLTKTFVFGIETIVFGMVPLRFLPGAKLRDWSAPRWLALWATGLVLFAHVIVYPVSTYEPNPSAVGLTTVVATVVIYGAIAAGFWGYFRFRRPRTTTPSPSPSAP
ncbi:MAG TPA: FGLLP motif-containing membrane protein [Candidatus Limnocylindrales bacterium]|nr:FGLLP motif-containing membrane protein [Candidatus Limnocylindrales bacterium]